MGKFSIKFDKTLLKSLKDDPESGVNLVKNKTHLAVHPFQLNEFNNSLKEILNQGVAKYSESLRGILLGYQNISLQTDLGIIDADSCFIHFDVNADFFVFKPEIGLELRGVVTKKSKDHVGCLVYNTFNVSLPKSECSDEEWIGEMIQSGHEVKFKITFVDLESRLPYIRGQLLEILNADQVPKKKNKIIKFDEEDGETLPQKKKEKKNAIGENANKPKTNKKRTRDEIIQEMKINEKVKKVKKSKKNKNKSQEESLEDLNLGDIFKFDSSVLNQTTQMADSEDAAQKIHNGSQHKIDVGNIEVELDSEIERIFDESKPKKRKRSKSLSDSPKKKKKSE